MQAKTTKSDEKAPVKKSYCRHPNPLTCKSSNFQILILLSFSVCLCLSLIQLVQLGHAIEALETVESVRNHDARERERIEEESRRSYAQQKAKMHTEVSLTTVHYLFKLLTVPFLFAKSDLYYLSVLNYMNFDL